MVQYKNLPPEISRQVAAFLKQSQIATAMRASKMTKSDMSPALQQRQKQINEKYNDFFKTMVNIKTKNKTVQEKEQDVLLKELREIVKMCNPNVVMRNGHTPLYNFIHTCKNVYLGKKFCARGIQIFIKKGVNVQEPTLVHYLLDPENYSDSAIDILPQLCKAGLIIKEKDFMTFLKALYSEVDLVYIEKKEIIKKVLDCIFYNIDKGVYDFDFSFREKRGKNIFEFFVRYFFDDELFDDISYFDKDELKEELEFFMNVFKRMNQNRKGIWH
jgi:hypothetical protein